MLEDLSYALKPWLKRLVIIAVVAGLGYLGYLGIVKGLGSLEPKNNLPTDPAQTTTEFFLALQADTLQQCYELLTKELRSATFAGLQSREGGYFPHFTRIRSYLTKYIGEDFTTTMVVAEGGRQVTFTGSITLNLGLEATRGSDKKDHFGIRRIVEFPIDVAPDLGTEKYYRGINRALESMGDLSGSGEVDDVSEVIQQIPGESDRDRQRRLFDSFRRARQLDTRHSILEWIIKESYDQSLTQKFLAELSDDENQPFHLRDLAKQTLAYLHSQPR